MLERILMASDCKGVVEEINQGAAMGHDLMLVKEIQIRKQEFQASILGHERREANGEANRMAQMATSLVAGRRVWLLNPPRTFLYL